VFETHLIFINLFRYTTFDFKFSLNIHSIEPSQNNHFLLPLTLLFTLGALLAALELPLTLCYSLVKVGSYGCTLSLTMDSGIPQKKMAPSEPTVTIVF
jgi:hypothetical protein